MFIPAAAALTYACLLAGFASTPPDRADRWKDPKPNLPDLSVRYIERLPRYPGTKVTYRQIDERPDGIKGDGLPVTIANPSQQKWPKSGQTVRFIARVRNSGSIPSPRYDWYWVIDGKDVKRESGSGWDEPLAPGAERVYEIEWTWKSGRHHVAFEVNRNRKFAEITHKNNAVVDATDALAFHFFVQPRVYAWFDSRKNGLDSYAWDDWAQLQVREMNREFRDEIHPATPAGITARVRLDRVVILSEDYKDPGGTHAPEDNVTGGSDGVWGFTNGLLEKNSEGKNFYEANPQWLLGPEWPLHHELGHQLGQPDYYLLPVVKERNEALPGVAYSPPSWFQDYMMFSGNHSHDHNIGRGHGTWDSGYRFWGEHAGRSLNRDADIRRGFFGTFLLDVPKVNRFVFLDEQNRPIAGAEIALHAAISREYGNPRFDDKPDYTGITGPDGSWLLNRSPYRVILNWTSNGALQFVLKLPGGVRRAGFLNITDFNLAYWRGHEKSATHYVATQPVP